MITVIAMLLIAQKGAQGLVQQQKDKPEEPGFSDLNFEISMPKETFNQLEPIPITLILSNRTSQTILGHNLLEFWGHYVQLFVSEIGGERQKIKDLTMMHALVDVQNQEIKPGQKHQSKQLIDIDLDKIFPYPGEYQLQAELLDVDGKKVIKSNHLRIRIVEPKGLDRQAFEFIKNNSNPSYFLNGYERIVDHKPLSILEEFVSKFSETAYGDYAVFQLSGVYFSNKDYEKAIKHLEKLAKKADFVFADKVQDYLREAKERIKH
jgi:hypothetical protein